MQISRFLAVLWLALCVGLYFLLQSNFRPGEALLFALWAALPLPLAYSAGTLLVATARGWTVIAAGLAVAFAFGAWLYWDAFLGPSSRTESLAGLIVLHAPLYQFVLLAAASVAAWFIERRGPSRRA